MNQKNWMMRNSKIVVFLIVIMLIMIACNKEEDEFKNPAVMKIEFGTMCGWCGGEEKLIITSIRDTYSRNIPCGEKEGTTTKSVVHRNRSYWEEIISSFNTAYFQTLDYSECNICVDGCDEFIIVTTRNSTHEIRYTPSRNIEGLDELRLLLTSRLEEFRE